MELSEMNLFDVDSRLAELETEVRETTDVETVKKATEEKKALLERKAELVDLEERKATAQKLTEGSIEPEKIVEVREEIKPMEEKKVYGIDSTEYRDAFYAMIAGNATQEQRTVLATPISVDGDASNDGSAIAIPKTLDTKIWDNIHTAHPVLDDISIISTGIVLEVTKHTAITAGKTNKKKDGATNSDASVAAEQNTFVKVQLVGEDYVKYVELTYAEAKMSQGAMEDYLAQEIADDLGEKLASVVFAKMVSDGTSNTTSKSTNGWFETIATALGTVSHAVNPVIYVTAANYYGIFGEVDTAGQPIFRDSVAIGAKVKIDSSVPSGTLAVVVDPAKFVLNVVQPVMIEKDKDVKEHKIIVSGYLRAEGCMRDNNAAGSITA